MPATAKRERNSPAELAAQRAGARRFKERAAYWRQCRDAMTVINSLPSPLDIALGMGMARNDPQWREKFRRASAWLESLADTIDEMEKPDGRR